MSKLTTLILLSSLSSAILTAPALAVPSGCTTAPPIAGEKHRLGGWKFGAGTTPNFWGISGAIETGSLDICPEYNNIPNGTFAWVGIDNNSVSSTGWVQIGYVKRTSLDLTPTTHVYTEALDPYKRGGTDPRPVPPGFYYHYEQGSPLLGGVNTYKVDLAWGGTNATSFWRYYVNSTQIFVTPPTAFSYDKAPMTPVVAKAHVELANPANQIPGTTANPVSFSNIQVKYTKTGAYSSLAMNKRPLDAAISSHARIDMTDPDTSWNVWDSRY